jgi:FdhD protein
VSADPEAAESIAEVGLVRFAAGASTAARDAVAREEPLEIQIGGTPLAVVMRTPGHDADLALGFLCSEQVITSIDDVLSVRHCREARSPEAADNVVRVALAEGVRVDWEALRRNTYASSSCGVCGKATIENALACAPPVRDPARFSAALFPPLPERLSAVQPGFARTGGLHAAALLDGEGALLVAREDVGRHNAVDKVIGFCLREKRWPLAGHVLLVSGRISFEIVQKALAARVPVVAGVSAPSSLAIELAERAGIALVGFLRGSSFNVYGDVSRVQVSRRPQGSEAAAKRGAAERSVGPHEGGEASDVPEAGA